MISWGAAWVSLPPEFVARPEVDVQRSVGQRLALAVATLGGVGYMPIASGTWGTLATIPLYLLIMAAGSPWVYGIALVLVTAIGIASADVVEKLLGKDPSAVVIDEAAGFLVTMFAVPLTVSTVAAGFFLFRLFDVIKVQPARALERQHGGFGIVADDLVCGLYANLVLQLGLRLLPAGAA